MPSAGEYYVLRAQVESFVALGFQTEFIIKILHLRYCAQIRLRKDTKEYRFFESDWDVISAQLATLYKVYKK